VRALEREFAEYCGARYALATNSGTAALHVALAAAGMLALALMLLQPWRGSTLMNSKTSSRELLTDNALKEVQQAEQAYTRSIDRLATIATQELERSSSPLAAAYREKLTVLDSAIAELKTNVRQPLQHVFAHGTGVALPAEAEDTSGVVAECEPELVYS
jgi:ATP-dependent exoDNAse (exonuclease V) beta subunit